MRFILIILLLSFFSCQEPGPIDADILKIEALLTQVSQLDIAKDRDQGLSLIAEADGIMRRIEEAGALLSGDQKAKLQKIRSSNQELVNTYMLYSKP